MTYYLETAQEHNHERQAAFLIPETYIIHRRQRNHLKPIVHHHQMCHLRTNHSTPSGLFLKTSEIKLWILIFLSTFYGKGFRCLDQK